MAAAQEERFTRVKGDNARGEPVVCTPADALRCFRDTRMDLLVLGPYVLERAAQPGWAAADAQAVAPAALALADGDPSQTPTGLSVRTCAPRRESCAGSA